MRNESLKLLLSTPSHTPQVSGVSNLIGLLDSSTDCSDS